MAKAPPVIGIRVQDGGVYIPGCSADGYCGCGGEVRQVTVVNEADLSPPPVEAATLMSRMLSRLRFGDSNG